MFFTELYRRVLDLERNEYSFVDCRKCGARIKKSNAYKVNCRLKDEYGDNYNYYCRICAPEYDTIIELEDDTFKYTKRVVEEVEVFLEEKK